MSRPRSRPSTSETDFSLLCTCRHADSSDGSDRVDCDGVAEYEAWLMNGETVTGSFEAQYLTVSMTKGNI